MIRALFRLFFANPGRKPAVWLSIVLGSLCLAIPGTSLAQAIPCASLGFDPAEEGEGILERFFVETDGVGGLGCWMHPHTNGKDAIFTPFSWGQSPNLGRQGLIDEVMEAIQETTDYLTALGTLNSELYILLTDLERDWQAEAHWLHENRCWIEITPTGGWGRWGRSDRRELQSTVAHEIAHCFFKENFEDYNEEGTDFDAWWDESGAEFLMAQIYPAVNSEHPSSIEFDLDGMEFLQEYNAVTLLQHYSNQKGVAHTLQFLQAAWKYGGEHARYANYLNSSGLDEFFHGFNLRHYNETVPDPGGGNMPREALVDFESSQRLDLEFGRFEVERIDPRRLVAVELILPSGYEVDIQAPESVNDSFHASIFVYGQSHSDWAGGMQFRADCSVDTSLRLLMTTLRTDGVNAGEFHYQTRRVPECDCLDYDTLDACLVGDWEMERLSRGLMFGSKEAPVGGRVALSFLPSGAFIYQFSNLTYNGGNYTRSGKLITQVLKTYNGNVRGCARTAPQAQRLDGGIPMFTEVVSDRVRRGNTITHGEVGTTTDKTEDGLEAWFWPNKSTFYRCEGDMLYLEKREFLRKPD
jgi:hypothetical protein